MEEIVNDVSVDFDPGIIGEAIGSRLNIANACSCGTDDYDFPAEGTWDEFALDHVGHGIVRIGVDGSVVVDQGSTNIVGYDATLITELDVLDTSLAVGEEEIVADAEVGAHRHDVERTIKVYFLKIVGTAIG